MMATAKAKGKSRRTLVEDALNAAFDELMDWHEDAEKENDYECPGCSTCATTIPLIKRALERLEVKR